MRASSHSAHVFVNVLSTKPDNRFSPPCCLLQVVHQKLQWLGHCHCCWKDAGPLTHLQEELSLHLCPCWKALHQRIAQTCASPAVTPAARPKLCNVVILHCHPGAEPFECYQCALQLMPALRILAHFTHSSSPLTLSLTVAGQPNARISSATFTYGPLRPQTLAPAAVDNVM